MARTRTNDLDLARDTALKSIYTKIDQICRQVATDAEGKHWSHVPQDQEHLATAIHTLAIAATRLEGARIVGAPPSPRVTVIGGETKS